MKRLALSLTLLLAAAPAVAQVDTANSFEARDENSSKAECSFELTHGFGTFKETKAGFLARPPRWDLNVSQLAGLGITAGQVDPTIAAAAALLQQDDSGPDVGCCVDFARSGGIGTVGTPSGVTTVLSCGGNAVVLVGGVVTTEVEFDTVRCATGNDEGDVIIVNGIAFCGVPGTYGGCASRNDALVVTSTAGANVWAHEFGHVQGLDHLPTCAGNLCGDLVTASCNCATAGASAQNVMFCIACTGSNVIRSSECNSYRSGATP